MILVLDFGSQYTQLIARRIREAKVYCEIHPFNISLERIKALKPDGIILSGGPASVYQENAPKVDPELFNLPVPFLGICYGMGIVNLAFGGEAGRAERREYGPANLIIGNTDLFMVSSIMSRRGWMSYGDKMTAFLRLSVLARATRPSPPSPIRLGVSSAQFHPKRSRRGHGPQQLRFRICRSQPNWTWSTSSAYRENPRAGGRRPVLCALRRRGFAVAATLIHRAIKRHLRVRQQRALRKASGACVRSVRRALRRELLSTPASSFAEPPASKTRK
jgi:GMP synthase (glutamine-hydrolysing)